MYSLAYALCAAAAGRGRQGHRPRAGGPAARGIGGSRPQAAQPQDPRAAGQLAHRKVRQRLRGDGRRLLRRGVYSYTSMSVLRRSIRIRGAPKYPYFLYRLFIDFLKRYVFHTNLNNSVF